MPVVIIPRGWAKYLCVFLGSLFIIFGMVEMNTTPVSGGNPFALGVLCLGIGLFNVVIGVLDFRFVRKFFMEWMRPMPLKQCPFCKETATIHFRNSLRTLAHCIRCNAIWRFHYNWWLSRKTKAIELVNVLNLFQKDYLIGRELPLSHWLKMVEDVETHKF
jgi:hypothetical protein